jgi:hypothetical protein
MPRKNTTAFFRKKICLPHRLPPLLSGKQYWCVLLYTNTEKIYLLCLFESGKILLLSSNTKTLHHVPPLLVGENTTNLSMTLKNLHRAQCSLGCCSLTPGVTAASSATSTLPTLFSIVPQSPGDFCPYYPLLLLPHDNLRAWGKKKIRIMALLYTFTLTMLGHKYFWGTSATQIWQYFYGTSTTKLPVF